MNICKLLSFFFCQVGKRRARARQRGPDVDVASCQFFLKSFLVGSTRNAPFCCPLIVIVIREFTISEKLYETTVPHVKLRFWTRLHFIRVVVHVFHTNTIIERQPFVVSCNFKTGHCVDKSIERFWVTIAQIISSFSLVCFITEIP